MPNSDTVRLTQIIGQYSCGIIIANPNLTKRVYVCDNKTNAFTSTFIQYERKDREREKTRLDILVQVTKSNSLFTIFFKTMPDTQPTDVANVGQGPPR